MISEDPLTNHQVQGCLLIAQSLQIFTLSSTEGSKGFPAYREVFISVLPRSASNPKSQLLYH